MEENARLARHYALISAAQSGDAAQSAAATEALLSENTEYQEIYYSQFPREVKSNG